MDSQIHHFLLLEGTDDDPWVQAVPISWYDDGFCWWPPKSKCKDVSRFINLGYEPNKKTWESYPARVRKAYATYAEARRHENKVVQNEDIATTEDEKDRRTRKSRKIKLPFDNSVSPPPSKGKQLKSRYREIVSSSDDDSCPIPPVPPCKILLNKLSVAGIPTKKSGNGGNALPSCSVLKLPDSNFDAQSDDSIDHYSPASTSKSITFTAPPVSVNPKSSSTSTKRSSFVEIRNGESRDEFLQRGLVTIGHDTRDNNVIGAALLDRLDRMETAFVAMKKLHGDADEDFMQMLPLNSIPDFDTFNDDLKSKSMSQRLRTHLIKIGGNSPRTIVRSIARRLITNELGKSFSWFGHRNNKKLSDTNIGKAIIAASVRNTPLITEADVKSTMIDMLRHCKDKPRTVPVL